MPRSVTDATRFTSTTPHASAKPGANVGPRASKTLPQRTPGPAGETPQEKVKRLREAAARARRADLSTADKVVISGRVWADRLHRFTALSLIAITGVAGVVTVYALGDMMIYNRKKRREYFAELQAKERATLHDARVAIEQGGATEEQFLLVERERANAQAAATAHVNAAKKDGIAKSAWSWLTSDLKKEEEGEDAGTAEARLGYESISEEDDVLGARESDIVRAIEERKSEVQQKAKKAFEKERELQKKGGPLDRIGVDETTEAPKSSGWTSFMTRK